MSIRFPLARALLLGPGRSAARVSAPTYLTLTVAVLILFGGNGITPTTVVKMAETSPLWMAVLFLAWVLGSGRAVRALFLDASLLALRAWPVPRWRLLSGLVFLCWLVELPWWLLWTLGAGPLEGVVMTLAALSWSLGWLPVAGGPARRILPTLLVASFSGAPAVLSTGPGFLAFAVASCAVFFITASTVWRHLPEPTFAVQKTERSGREPLQALVVAYWRSVRRGFASVLVASLLVLAASAWLVAQWFSEPTALVLDEASLGAILYGVNSTLACCAMCWLLFRVEEESSPVLACSAVSDRVRRAAVAGVVLSWGAVLGAVFLLVVFRFSAISGMPWQELVARCLGVWLFGTAFGSESMQAFSRRGVRHRRALAAALGVVTATTAVAMSSLEGMAVAVASSGAWVIWSLSRRDTWSAFLLEASASKSRRWR